MTYSDPFKLRVLKALTASLKQITPANGYVNDMADFDPGDGVSTSRVFRGRAWFGENDPIPMISILEASDPADELGERPVGVSAAAFDWDLMIQGFVEDDPDNPTDPAYLLLADVRRRLAYEATRRKAGDPTELDVFGLKSAGDSRNGIDKLTFDAGVVRPADDVSAKSWFWLRATLRVVDNPAAPYE